MSKIHKIIKGSLAVLLASTSFAVAGGGEDEVMTQIADLQKRLHDLEDKAYGNHYVSTFRDPKRFKVTLSGHLNRAALWANNARQSKLFHVDNNSSPSRFAVGGEATVNTDLDVKTLIEFQMKDNSSSAVNYDKVSGDTETSVISTRKMDIHFAHKKYGEIHMGKGDTASDHITEQDLSGTYVCTAGTDVPAIAGAIKFQDKRVAGDATTAEGPTVGSTFSNMDGLGRKNRIKYVSPSLLGIQLQAGHVSGDSVDASARFHGAFGDTKVAAAVGAAKDANKTNGETARTFAGSVSVLLPVGLNFTYAMGHKSYRIKKGTRSSGHFVQGKIGYRADWFDMGQTKLAVDLSQHRKVNSSATYFDNGTINDGGEKGRGISYAGMIVQDINKSGTELFLLHRTYKLNKLGNPAKPNKYSDIKVVLAGARLKF